MKTKIYFSTTCSVLVSHRHYLSLSLSLFALLPSTLHLPPSLSPPIILSHRTSPCQHVVFCFLKWMPSVFILCFSPLSDTWTQQWMRMFCFASLSTAHIHHVALFLFWAVVRPGLCVNTWKSFSVFARTADVWCVRLLIVAGLSLLSEEYISGFFF